MRAVVQRVSEASVTVAKKITGSIGPGLVVFLGVGRDDTLSDVEYLAAKIAVLRIFEDEEALMNRSVTDIDGSILCVSQFTLYGDCRKGRRPGFSDAAGAKDADRLYRYFIERLGSFNIPVEEGIFQADMQVSIVNDGPVTILLDSKKKF